nr:hypothetical protein [Actinoplanes sp. ATCC 53533]
MVEPGFIAVSEWRAEQEPQPRPPRPRWRSTAESAARSGQPRRRLAGRAGAVVVAGAGVARLAELRCHRRWSSPPMAGSRL